MMLRFVAVLMLTWGGTSSGLSDSLPTADELSKLRDRLFADVVKDRPAEVILGNIGLNLIARRADAGDADARGALQAFQSGRIDEALSKLEAAAMRLDAAGDAKASDLWQTLGLFAGMKDATRAAAAYDHALDLTPGDFDARYGLAIAQIALGRVDEATANLTQVVAATKAEPSLFYQYWACLRLVSLQVAAGKLEGAAAALRDLDAKVGRFVAANPSALAWERDLGVAWHLLGQAEVDHKDPAAALVAHRLGLTIDERLAAADPRSDQWQRDLSYGEEVTGDAMVVAGDIGGAMTIYGKSVAIVKGNILAQPYVIVWRRDSASLDEKIADLVAAKGDFVQAKALLLESIGVANWLGRVVKETDGRWHEALARREMKLAVLLDTKMHDLPSAIDWYDALRSLDSWLVRCDPQSRPRRRDLAAAFQKLGDAYARNHDGNKASEAFGHALGIDAKLVADDPTDMRAQADLATMYETFGDAAQAAHDDARAAEIFKLDVMTRTVLASAAQGDAKAQHAAALASEKLGDALAATGDKASALKSYRSAAGVYEALSNADPRDAGRLRDLAVALNEAGCIELALGEKKAALADFERRQTLFDAIADAAPDDLDKQHERFLSTFQLHDALTDAGQPARSLVVLRAARVNAAAVIARHPGDSATSRTLAWVEEELAKPDRSGSASTVNGITASPRP